MGMEYIVGKELIKSQNTAKSHIQQSKAVIEYFRSQKRVTNILDFGCGKLRYADLIVKICNSATFVDSRIQLSRIQIVRGEKTTVTEYVANHYQQCHVVAFEDIVRHSRRYDLITCTNVLSAIPCEKTVNSIFIHMQRLLNNEGKVLFVNQYRNSYFKKYKLGKRHLFGYLFNNRNIVSYYGIIRPNQIEKLLSNAGFFVEKVWCIGEINFVEAKRAVINYPKGADNVLF